jgi:CHAD domain-containing protein
LATDGRTFSGDAGVFPQAEAQAGPRALARPAVVGPHPEAYGAGFAPRHPRDLRADHAAAAGCRRLLDDMVAHGDGVRRGPGARFLHDFRVSVRRTRSLLSQLDKVFAPDAAARFRREFKWLGSVTGAARDLDVYLLKMDGYHAKLPADTADHLAPLNEFLRRRRDAERRRLLTALGSGRYGKLVDDWRAFLDGDIAGDSPPADARRSVVDVAGAHIWRAYRLVHHDDRNIDADSSAEALHDLRIDCKKLRYLLEFFCDLYHEGDIAPLLKSLKRLQSNLGDFNDLEVQQRTLQRFAPQMEAQGTVSVQCQRAIARLLDHLVRQQADERRRFATSFERFSTDDNRAGFERLFKPLPPAGYSGPSTSSGSGGQQFGEY